MPSVATWMDLEIIILSEVNQTEKDKYNISFICRNLKNSIDELIYETEIDSQTQKTNLRLPREMGEGDKLEIWDWHIHTTMYKIGKQQGYTVQHREL